MFQGGSTVFVSSVARLNASFGTAFLFLIKNVQLILGSVKVAEWPPFAITVSCFLDLYFLIPNYALFVNGICCFCFCLIRL